MKRTIAGLIAFVVFLCVLMDRYGDMTVKVDQVWVYRTHNIFEPFVSVNTVLEVQGEYVRYRDQHGRVRSESVNWFLTGSEKIK